MSRRTREIVKRAIELAEINNDNWNENVNNIVPLNNYEVVENVNIEIMDYPSVVSEEIDLPYYALDQTGAEELEMLEAMDIEVANEEVVREIEGTSIKYKSDVTKIQKIEEIGINLEETKKQKTEENKQNASERHLVGEIIDKEETNDHRIDEAKNLEDASQKMSLDDISDDSDYIAPNLVPYSESNCDYEEMPTRTKKRRKRFQVDKASWFSERNKNRREMGKRYFGRTKINGKWSYDIEREPRELKERCRCIARNGVLKCSQITEQQRKVIFKYFWALSWGEKKFLWTVL